MATRQLRLILGLMPLALSTVLCLPRAAAQGDAVSAIRSPLEPEESLAHFKLAPGVKIELAAAEPEVVDPVAIRFDEDGRMWVVEMGDYPNGPSPGERPLSRIKVLEDSDGDGRFETASLFADQLLFATGIQPWHGGVIATFSGRVEWMKDTDGDGQADLRETWFTGFAEENPQLRANHPRFALDNFIYVASGLRGGMITSTWSRTRREVSLSGRDFRFEPLRGDCEAVAGNGQFGMTFDDYGNRFLCSNRNPLMHVVLEDRYLARNPLLAVPAVVNDVAAAGDNSHVYPLSSAWTTSILHAGQFTAACGAEVYRGAALPERFYGCGFTCEPTGNLVHCEVLEPAGATFVGRPEREGAEFLATADSWFRPVNLETGPDGALYVVDMYRAVIEHPQFVPDELKSRPDLRFGDDRGRVYRLVAEGTTKRPAAPQLGQAGPEKLAPLLADRNPWYRNTAARLMYEHQWRQAKAVVEAIARRAEMPAARVQALWTLHGWRQLPPEMLREALDDRHPRVREAAVLLSETLLAENADLRGRIVKLAGDPDARLRFQVALSLGAARSDDVLPALVQIGLAGADDAWTRRAVLTAVPDRPHDLLVLFFSRLNSIRQSPAGIDILLGEIARLVGARRQADEVAGVLHSLASQGSSSLPRRMAILAGMALGMQARGLQWSAMVGRFAQDTRARDTADAIFQQAAGLLRDTAADVAMREQACTLLQFGDDALAIPALAVVIESEPNQSLRLQAVTALAAHSGSEVTDLLITVLDRQTSAVRRAVLNALLARPDRVGRLLDEIAAGRLKASELDPLQTSRLLQHADAQLRARAQELFAAVEPPERAEVVRQYRAALDLPADPRHGREVFQKNCATCHRIGTLGVDVAPSIADLRSKTLGQILVDILEPNRAIDNNYVSYSVTTADGQSVVGVISAETASSITLKQPEGKVLTLARGDIEDIRSNGVSLMPEGLEKNIPLQDMADVISFIKNWRYLEAALPARAGKVDE
ncbi:MAG TPA: PVC-type heme-binding CxxCH protein [Pirellulales bacterium]|nr:PVC-type heme-binding CxxCH protein [Pirellulales bacterium]